MRAFIVKFAGLALHIYDLQPGTLAIRHERAGKQPWEYTLTEKDFEDSAEFVEDETPVLQETGMLASAIGLRLHLIKNEGQLKLAFTGEDGDIAEWHFNSMEVVGGGQMTACAFTQTYVDASSCSTCGVERKSSLAVSNTTDFGTQTRTTHFTSSDAQTQTLPESRATVEASHPLKPDNPENPLKRKAQDLPHDLPPVDKRAKSSHNSAQWPKHLYITCFRNSPIFKGDVGTMHIDIEEGTVWFEGWYGRPHMRVFERKQVDLRDENTTVAYYIYESSYITGRTMLGIDGATHYIAITRPSVKDNGIKLFIADCSAPGWEMWGTNTATNAKEERVPIDDPTVIIDAIVHCVDRASGRPAVHDPDRHHALRAECNELIRLAKQKDPSGNSWPYCAINRLREQDKRRERLRIVELE